MSSDLTFRADPASLADIRAALNQFTIKVQDRISKTALREFAKAEMSKIRAVRVG